LPLTGGESAPPVLAAVLAVTWPLLEWPLETVAC